MPAPAPAAHTMTGNEPEDWVGMPSPDNFNLQKMSPSEAAEQAAAMDKLAKVRDIMLYSCGLDNVDRGVSCSICYT